MQTFDFPRRLAAEALGTGLLVATVVGSGVMAESLTKDVALQLLCNTLPTGAILVVLAMLYFALRISVGLLRRPASGGAAHRAARTCANRRFADRPG